MENCRFDSIMEKNGEFSVKKFSCEGCGVCEYVCPSGAITMQKSAAGDTMIYKEGDRVFSTAKLYMGSGTSGKLVTEVKKNMRDNAADNVEIAVIDGSPGIGCPVIASLNGVDALLIVAEPSISGMSDMERIITTAARFRVKTAVCVNKFDTNIENTNRIEEFCKENNISLVGKIPYDTEAVKAINSGKTIVEVDCPSGNAVREVYKKVVDMLSEETEKVSKGKDYENVITL